MQFLYITCSEGTPHFFYGKSMGNLQSNKTHRPYFINYLISINDVNI